MKKMFFASILLLAGLIVYGQNSLEGIKVTKKSFPTNLHEKNFNQIEEIKGDVVAFDGVIEQIETSRNNTPFYKLRIGEKSYLWTVLMFKNDVNKVGDTIRVVGYTRAVPTEPTEKEKKYLDGNYMVISFGMVDFAHSNMFFVFTPKQKQEWIDGKIPSSN